ncbi:urease accessory protein UreD [Salsuginibacillus kocurii]|uniref:urease accessory protein UreD n=1 Tax=Salsuginibacillus kocurii TaxID=427078 RepID=UPI00037F2718|nr:urease accessory protein UreD [Salsuginibacillus kocurii]
MQKLNPELDTTLALSGEVKADFGMRRGKTVITNHYETPPLKVSRLMYPEIKEHAIAYLVETSGGMVAGDQYRYTLRLDKSAALTLIPQSSLKIYPQKNGEGAVQFYDVQLADDTFLKLSPDTIIPFAASRFQNEQRITMNGNASLIWGEILSAGRREREEIYDYERIDSTFSVRVEGKLLIYDSLVLEPQTRFVHEQGMMDGNDYYAVLWAVSPYLKETTSESWMEQWEAADSVRKGVTKPEPNIVHARILSNDLIELKKAYSQLEEKVETWIREKRSAEKR